MRCIQMALEREFRAVSNSWIEIFHLFFNWVNEANGVGNLLRMLFAEWKKMYTATFNTAIASSTFCSILSISLLRYFTCDRNQLQFNATGFSRDSRSTIVLDRLNEASWAYRIDSTNMNSVSNVFFRLFHKYNHTQAVNDGKKITGKSIPNAIMANEIIEQWNSVNLSHSKQIW